jgi:uncharacterized protein (DUF58 family)
MIVPGIRAIVIVGAGGVALALADAAFPQGGTVWLAAALVMVVLLVIDALRAWHEARGLTVILPSLMRTVRGRGFELPVTLSNTSSEDSIARALRIALQLPEGVIASTEAIECGDLGARQKITVNTQLTCSQRGEFLVAACAVHSISPWSCWNSQLLLPLTTTIRAYPDLLGDRTAAEFLQRGKAGERVMRHSGKGREFEKLREYLYGDSWDEIDWKATARRGQPVVRVFQVEKTQEIYVAIDTSRLSARMADEQVTLDQYVHSALVMALAAEAQGDLFGLITFSDRIHNFVRAQKGKAHFKTCREAIYNARPRQVEPDFGEFFAFLETRLTRRALVIVLTALDDPLAAETFSKDVGVASRRHLLIAAMPTPGGARPLFETPAADTEEMYERLGGHLRWRQLAEVQKACQRKGVALHLLSPEKITGQLAGIYLDVKRRQLL